jgi:hypothetical protein
MGFKAKAAGFIAAIAIAIGVSAPALANDDQQVEFEITPGSEFSVEIIGGGNFRDTEFDLAVLSTVAGNGYYDYKVTDLRGTGLGWNVKASTTGFYSSTGDLVEGAILRSTNNTPWATHVPAGPNGFSADAGSITTGVTATSSWNSIVGAGRVLLQATPGINDSYPNGTGVFYDEEALYLEFPSGIAAGTYTATVLLTLSSGNP